MNEDPVRPFYDQHDEECARAYIEERYAVGAFDPIVQSEGTADAVALASVNSARDYMLQSQGTRAASGASFRVYPGAINSIEPNAFAGLNRDLHVIGLHAGLYAMIFEVACFVMAQRELFAEVGNPERELSPNFPPGSYPAYWLIDQTVVGRENADLSFAEQLLPQDPERYMFAIYLALMMMRFAWFHELFHCLNGHVGYISTLKTDLRLTELGDGALLSLVEVESELPLPPQRVLQALELDADRSALYASYRTQAEDKENIVGIANLPRPTRAKLSLFSGYMMTLLFAQIASRAQSQGTTIP